MYIKAITKVESQCRGVTGEDGVGIGTSGKGPSGVWNQSDIMIGSIVQKWITISGKRPLRQIPFSFVFLPYV